MALKNYTSSIPASRSLSYIEQKLADHGARQIMKDYDQNKRVTRISFVMEIRDGDRLVLVPFRLPAQVEQCEAVLLRNLSRRAKPDAKKRVAEQAERTAWKIIADWVDAQIAMVELAQVEIMQVLLPYVYDAKKDETFYERIKNAGIAKLTGGA